MSCTPILKITDGTTTINLLTGDGGAGFYLEDWIPTVPAAEVTWRSSQTAGLRKPVGSTRASYIETFELRLVGSSVNDAAARMSKLRTMLDRARNYWLSPRKLTATPKATTPPVYLIARAAGETNTRYAQVTNAAIADESNPYSQPFLQPRGRTSSKTLTLALEHLGWMELPPLQGNTLSLSTVKSVSSKNAAYFAQSATLVYSSDSVLDGLLDVSNTFAIEGWLYLEEDNTGSIVNKGTWEVVIGEDGGGKYLAYYAYNTVSGGPTEVKTYAIETETWFHFAVSADAGSSDIEIFIDGVIPAYDVQSIPVMPSDDDGHQFCVGGTSVWKKTSSSTAAGSGIAYTGKPNFGGRIAWLRLSDNQRYTVNFTPPDLCDAPADDANTIIVIPFNGVEYTTTNDDYVYCYGNTVGVNFRLSSVELSFTEACTIDVGQLDDIDGSPTPRDWETLGNIETENRLTHIFHYDASGATYSSNLMLAPVGASLFPAIPATGDIVYFGVETTSEFDASAAPFYSLVLDYYEPMYNPGEDSVVTWQYWDAQVGTWFNLAIYGGILDGTNGFGPYDDDIVNAVVSWIPISMSDTTVNSVNAYWIRAYVNSAPLKGAPNTVILRSTPYIPVWNHATIDGGVIDGDMPATVDINVRPRAARLDESDGNLSYSPQAPADDAWIDDGMGTIDTINALHIGTQVSSGIRFPDVQVPPNAFIASATITITPSTNFDTGGLGDILLNIACEDADNPAQFTTYANYIARPRTTADTQWQITTLVAGTPVTSPSFAASVKEVVDRSGWAAGNAIVVFLDDELSCGFCGAQLYQQGSGAGYEAVLSITYIPFSTYTTYIAAALRSGTPDFRATLPLVNRTISPNLRTSALGDVSYIPGNWWLYPTGGLYRLPYTSTNQDPGTWFDIMSVTIGAAVSDQYYGRYRASIAAIFGGGFGADDVLQLRIAVRSSESGQNVSLTQGVVATAASSYGTAPLLDLGYLNIPDLGTPNATIELVVQGNASFDYVDYANTRTVGLYAINILPIDEWYGEWFAPDGASLQADQTNVVSLSNIQSPRKQQAVLRNGNNNLSQGTWALSSPKPALLQATDSEQRMFFVFGYNMDYPNSGQLAVRFGAVHDVSFVARNNYYSLRGDS